MALFLDVGITGLDQKHSRHLRYDLPMCGIVSCIPSTDAVIPWIRMLSPIAVRIPGKHGYNYLGKRKMFG